jgi:ribosome recycling factor
VNLLVSALVFLAVSTGVPMLADAQAATPITSVTLVEGGSAVHVTVYDQNTTNAIPPANINWTASSVISMTADSTGFNISALPRSTAFSFGITATDIAQTPNVAGTLTINVVLPNITSLTFASP